MLKMTLDMWEWKMTTHVVKSFSKLNQQMRKRKAETQGTRICQVLLFSRVEINISINVWLSRRQTPCLRILLKAVVLILPTLVIGHCHGKL